MNKLLKLWHQSSLTMRVLFVFVVFVFLRFIFKRSSVENFGNPASCNYYYMEQCGHCKRFSPEWDQFVQTYTGPVKLRKMEMNEAGSDLEKYNIQGFPTILCIDENGETKDYDGPRTSDALNQFIDNL